MDQEENLGGRNFLSLLGEGDREVLLAQGGRRRFSSGGTLMYERQLAEEVLVLLGGPGKITHTTPRAARSSLASVDRARYRRDGRDRGRDRDPAPSRRSSRSRRWRSRRAGFGRMLKSATPGLAVAVLRSISRRFADANRQLVQFAAAHTLGRVASRSGAVGALWRIHRRRRSGDRASNLTDGTGGMGGLLPGGRRESVQRCASSASSRPNGAGSSCETSRSYAVSRR